MTDDLVQRLRADVFYGDARLANMDKHNPLHMEAADRIEQLEREKAVVSDLWEQQKEIALDYLADCNKAAERIEALEAEVTRLKDKLSLETEPSPYCPICGSCGDEGCCGSKRCMYPDTGIEALEAENKRLREHLISALDTLKDAEVCDDNCGPCNEAYAALQEQSK